MCTPTRKLLMRGLCAGLLLFRFHQDDNSPFLFLTISNSTIQIHYIFILISIVNISPSILFLGGLVPPLYVSYICTCQDWNSVCQKGIKKIITLSCQNSVINHTILQWKHQIQRFSLVMIQGNNCINHKKILFNCNIIIFIVLYFLPRNCFGIPKN